MTDHPGSPPDDPPPASSTAGSAEETGDGAAIEDAAAVALARAREAARAAGLRPSASGRTGRRRRPGTDAAGEAAAAANGVRSGEGRDPVTLGAQLDRLVTERGWQTDVAVGSVIARWPAVIGPTVAQHVTPETFEDGVLTVRADSTSWATELRYMVPMLLERLAAEVGEGMVTDLRVIGPAGRSWRHGRRTAPGGRGPRDTYG